METNSLFDQSILRQRYQEYLREVAHEQLIQEVKSSSPKAHERLLESLSNLLIRTGRWLQNRYQSPATVSVPQSK